MMGETCPPAGVYLMALDSRLMSTWLSRFLSPTKSSWGISPMEIWKLWRFSPAMGRMMTLMDSISSSMEKTDWRRDIFPLSILLMSKTSLMSPRRWLLAALIFRVYSRTLTLLSGALARRVEKPMTAFMGVRISWDILLKKVVLAALASRSMERASWSWALCRACMADRSLADRLRRMKMTAARMAGAEATMTAACTGCRRVKAAREKRSLWRLPVLR